MSQNNDLQSAIPSHYDLSNSNIDFEDAGRIVGGPLLSAVAAIIGGDESDAVGVLRAYSEESNIGVLDAALTCIVSKSAEVDANIAGIAMRSLLSDELVEPPAVIARDEVYREIVDDDGIYDRVSAVASQLPDSLCARVADLIDRSNELDIRIAEAEDKYDNDMAAAEDNEDYNSFVSIQNEYDGALADVAEKREDLVAEIKSVRADILAISGDKVEAQEQQLVEKLVNTDYDSNDIDTIRSVEREIKDYIAEHPDSVLTDVMATREEYHELLSKVDFGSDSEAKTELAEKYQTYHDTCRGVLFADVDTGAKEPRDVEKAPEAVDAKPERDDAKVEYKEYPLAAIPDIAKQDADKDIRSDAKAVVEYGVAERVYAQKEDYPAFNDGKDLIHSVYRAYDDIEAMGKSGGFLSAELKATVDELDTLGDKNGDIEHDSRIDALLAHKEDIIHYAGAVSYSDKSGDVKEQEDVVRGFHNANMELRHGSKDEILATGLEVYHNAIKDLSGETGVDRDGVAARYQRDFSVRNSMEMKVRALEEVYKNAAPEDRTEASSKLYEARLELDKTQRQLDMKYFEIEIGVEGAEKYGVLDLPVVIEEKKDIEGTPTVKPDKPVEDPQAKYDAAKEKYEEIKDKYLFRNTFVCVDRLSMDIEAYYAKENGANGHPVSGGVLAMDVIELVRSNLFSSVFEVAVRGYFDEIFPAPDVDKVDRDDAPNIGHIGKMETVTDFSGKHGDTGIVEAEAAKGVTTENPAYGKYMGADTTVESIYNDDGMKVYNCGPKDVDFTVTTGLVDKNGNADVMDVPPIRLVMNGESRYLVDPFGQTLNSNVTTDAKSLAQQDAICKPHFAALDISDGPHGKQRMEAVAASRGMDISECKRDIVDRSMQNYVDRGLSDIQKHGEYIKEKLLPETLSELSGCRERIAFLDDVKGAFEKRVENPTGYDTKDMTERFGEFIDHVDTMQGKLVKLEAGLTGRVEKLSSTLDLYKSVGTVCREIRDVDEKFNTVARGSSQAYGKIDNPYYGITVTDLQSIDKLLDKCGFKAEEKLKDTYVDRGWPQETEISLDWAGGKHVYFEEDTEVKEMRTETRSFIGELYPDFEDRWPGLIDRGDRDVFDTQEFNVKAIMVDMGVVPVDKEEQIAESKKDVVTENQQFERLGMFPYIKWSEAQQTDYFNGQVIHPAIDSKTIPTESQIEHARAEIKENAMFSLDSSGYGTRVNGPDLDWNTVAPREIIQEGKEHFWVRPDGEPAHVKMTAIQASAYLRGPLDKSDVATALEKYLDVSEKPDSTYSFSTDFLEVNKFRVDPQAVLEVFSDKLKEFVSSDDEKSPYVVETIADCLASIKDEIVSRFTDTVADKVDDVVRSAIDGGREERVSVFVDKVSSVFESVVDRAQSGGVDVESVKLSSNVAEKLESLRDKGVSDKDIASIEDIAKALDAVFEGYSDLLKTVLVECATEADAKVERDEDAVAASGDEEDSDEVDKDDDADESESDDMDSGVFKIVENVAESISDIVDGFERIESDVDQEDNDVERDEDRVE